MAYSTGTANNPTDLLQQLATFAAAHGWTIDRNASYSGNYWMALHNGGAYFNFATEATAKSFLVCGATGYSGAATPSTQAGTSPQATYTIGLTGPYTAYYFFSGTTYLHIVIEVNAGVFMSIMIGKLPATGGITDAQYVQGVSWGVVGGAPDQVPYPYNNGPFFANCYAAINLIGATVDSVFRWFQAPQQQVAPLRYQAPITAGGILNSLILRSPNTFNGLTPLLPVPIFLERAVGNIYSFAGMVPDFRVINILNVNPKDEITIGSNVWKLFPVCAKTATWSTGSTTIKSSGPYGMAFLK